MKLKLLGLCTSNGHLAENPADENTRNDSFQCYAAELQIWTVSARRFLSTWSSFGSKYLPYSRLAANQQTKLWQIDTNCRSEHPCQHCIRPSHHRLRHPRGHWARYLNYKQNRKGWQFQPHQKRFTKKGWTTQPGLQHSEDLRRLRLCGLSANPQHCNTSRYLIDSLTPDCIDV